MCALGSACGRVGPPAIVLRIGINLGDVIIEGDDIYGDGVNVAARLEALAEPGGICISSVVNESVGTRLDVVSAMAATSGQEYRPSDPHLDLGARCCGDDPSGVPSDSPAPRKEIVDRRSPFDNMSGDAQQEFSPTGSPRTSSPTFEVLRAAGGRPQFQLPYKGRRSMSAPSAAISASRRAGRLRPRAGTRLRITADDRCGKRRPPLGRRFDRDISDFFEIQDDVTGRIVEALKVTIVPRREPAFRVAAPVISMPTTASFVHAPCWWSARPSAALCSNRPAASCARRSNWIRTLLAQAYAGLGVAFVLNYQNRWTEDSSDALLQAKQAVDRAIELDPQELLARVVASLVATFEADLDRAKSEANMVLTINPNSSEAYSCLGSAYIFSGQPLEAIPMIELSIRLDPANTQQSLHLLGVAYLLAGKYERRQRC